MPGKYYIPVPVSPGATFPEPPAACPPVSYTHLVVCYSLVYALSQDILNYALKAAGISYLSFENARQLITSPLSVILLLALLFFITIVTFFELSALYIYCEKGWSREQLPLRHLIKYSAQSCWELLHVKTLLFFWGFMPVSYTHLSAPRMFPLSSPRQQSSGQGI